MMPVFLQLFIVLCFQVVAVRSAVDNDFSNCNEFFYKNTPPQLERSFSHPPKRICQRYENRYHYATLYSTSLRIPLFSAYVDTGPCQGSQSDRRATWFVEPQLLPVAGTMGRDSMELARGQTSNQKGVQAINDDYRNTGYDRGHLNPNFYQCDESRTATFTLTNAVPQDPCFNQQIWKKMEEVTLQKMRSDCSFPGAKRFFVTGIVKKRTRIPNEAHDKEGDVLRDYNRVTIPSHMWTAVCCDASNSANKENGFSFAYIGENNGDSSVRVLTVSALEAKLTANSLDAADRYETANIFADDCNENSEKSRLARDHVRVPVDNAVANALDSISKMEQSSIPPKKRKVIHEAVAFTGNKKVAAYDYSLVRVDIGITLPRNVSLINETRDKLLKEGADLLLFKPHDFTAVPPTHTELSDSDINFSFYGNYTASTKQKKNNPKAVTRGRQYLHGLDDDKQEGAKNDQANSLVKDEYLIVPDTSAIGSDITIGGDRCRKSSCRYQGKSYKWCYIDWSNNWEYCCTDKCVFKDGYSYSTCETGAGRKACSLRSSVYSIKGRRCIAGHECGLHNENYYWCYTDTEKNWDYCCQPWHTCGKHKTNYSKWCYTGVSKDTKWKYCYY